MNRFVKFLNLIEYTNYFKEFCILILLTLIMNVTEMFGFVMIIPIVVTFLNDGPKETQIEVIDNLVNMIFNYNLNLSPLAILMLVVSIIFGIKIIFYTYTNYKTLILSNNIGAKIADKIFKFELDKDYLDQHELSSSDKIRKTLFDTIKVSVAIKGLINIISELILFIIILIILLIVEINLVYSIFFVFLLAFAYIKIFNKAIYKTSKNQQKKYTDWFNFLQDSFGGIKLIKINNSEKDFLKLHEVFSESFFTHERKLGFFYLYPRIFFEILMIVFFAALIILFKFILEFSNDIIIPILTLFALIAIRIVPSINKIIVHFQNIVQAEPYLEKIYEAYITNNNLSNKINITDNKKLINFNNILKIQNLNFSYNENKIIFENLNLSISKNKIIGIYGPSGSGKTTLVDLISGLMRPNSGKISIDDSDIFANLKYWQSKIGYVYQDTFIVDSNLRENILFSKKNLIDDEYNKKIIKLLNLDDLITETTAGERGSKLSGGQKQRIGIARALVSKPELLILDEFTSSLDIKTEEEILSVVDEIKKNLNTTTIMISHRKNPFKICDEIYKLENKDLFLLDKLE